MVETGVSCGRTDFNGVGVVEVFTAVKATECDGN